MIPPALLAKLLCNPQQQWRISWVKKLFTIIVVPLWNPIYATTLQIQNIWKLQTETIQLFSSRGFHSFAIRDWLRNIWKGPNNIELILWVHCFSMFRTYLPIYWSVSDIQQLIDYSRWSQELISNPIGFGHSITFDCSSYVFCLTIWYSIQGVHVSLFLVSLYTMYSIASEALRTAQTFHCSAKEARSSINITPQWRCEHHTLFVQPKRLVRK